MPRLDIMLTDDSSRSLGRRLLGNSLWNVASYFFYLGLTFISLPVFLSSLGQSHYGVLVLLGSLTAPLGLLNLGFGQATIKYVAERVARRDYPGAARFVNNTLLFNLATGAIGAAALIWLAPVLATKLFKLAPGEQPLVEACLHWTAATWFSTQTAAAFIAVPTALQRFGLVSLGTTIFNSVSLLLSLAPLLLGYGLLAVVKVRFWSSLMTVLGWGWLARTLLPQLRLWPAYDPDVFRCSFGFGVWQTAATLGGLLANQSDKYLLGIYLSAEAVGLFNVPYLIFSTVFTVVTKLSESLFPAVSDLQGRGRPAQAVDVLLSAGAWLSLLMVCLQGTVYVFAGDILRLYVGSGVAQAGTQVLRIFAITAVIAAPSIVLNQYLLGSGATAWLAFLTTASGVSTFLFSWVLIPRFGLAGAAWSDLAAILLSRPLCHWAIWRARLRNQVKLDALLRALYSATLVGTPAALALGWARDRLIGRPGWLEVVLGAVVTVFFLGGLLLFTNARLFGRGPGGAELVKIFRHFGSGGALEGALRRFRFR